MKQAIRFTSGIVAVVLIIAAIYFGISDSWSIAILFFLLFGGVEFTIWALEKPEKERDSG